MDYDIVHRAMIDERILAESEWLDGPKDTNEEMGVEEFEGKILVRGLSYHPSFNLPNS